MELVNSIVGVSTFLGSLMLYAGYIYLNAYFGHFHLDSFAVGFSPFEMVVRSLRLATLPALEVLAVLLLAPGLLRLAAARPLPERFVPAVRTARRILARAHVAVTAAGVGLMLLWRWIQPYGWLAPLLVAGGLLLGRVSAADRSPGATREQPWQRALTLVVAALFLVWAVALVAGQLGRQDARRDADQLVRRVAVVILSTERLDLASPGLHVQDQGPEAHYRYRYTGLRLLVERDHRFYLVTLGWRKATDPTLVFEDDDSTRIELRPGTQPRS